MNTKIENIKIDSFGLHIEYIKKDGAIFNLKINLNRPSDKLRNAGYIKCENILPVKFSFKHSLYLNDGYSVKDNCNWDNNLLEFIVNSNNDIKKIKLNCTIKELPRELCKKVCIEAKFYKEDERHKKTYLIECPDNKVILIKGYDLSDYLKTHNGKLHENDYDEYLKIIDNVYIDYE